MEVAANSDQNSDNLLLESVLADASTYLLAKMYQQEKHIALCFNKKYMISVFLSYLFHFLILYLIEETSVWFFPYQMSIVLIKNVLHKLELVSEVGFLANRSASCSIDDCWPFCMPLKFDTFYSKTTCMGF